MIRATSTLFLAVVLATAFATVSFGQDAGGRLRVGVFDKPPFAMKTGDGHWTGLAVVLWNKIAANLHLPFDCVEVPEDQMITRLSQGTLDLCIGEMAVSAERQRMMDFSQPYLSYPSAVAISRKDGFPRWLDFIQDISGHGLLTILVAMIGTLLAFSLMLWMAERRVNNHHFGGRPIQGFGSALWFAAVTMTTVGYGDKTPQSPVGRSLALLWMFSGILLVSAFTGTVASSISVARMNQSITRIPDLAKYRNGVMTGTIAESVLTDAGIAAATYPTVEEGLQALAANKISAFVSNGITLRYLVNQRYPDTLAVISLPTTHVHYALAVRPGLPILRELNCSLLEITNAPDWQREIDRFVGPSMPQQF